MKRVATALVFSVAVQLVAPGAPAVAQPNEAEKLYRQGQTAYDGKRYDGALVAWLRAYELSKLPGLLFNIAQAYRLRGLPGDCTKAAQTYERFVAAAPTSPQVPAARGFIAELAPCVAGLPATNNDRPAGPDRITRPSPPIEPKRELLSRNAAMASRVTPPAAQPQPADSLQPRASGLTSSVEGEHGASKLRLPTYLVGGASLALVGTGVYFGLRARSISDEVDAKCAKGCEWSTVASLDEEGRSAQTKQWVFYGFGVGGLAATYLLHRMSQSTRTHQIALTPTDQGALVSWGATW